MTLFRCFFALLAFSLVACAAPSSDDAAEESATSESGLGSLPQLSATLRSQTALDRARSVDEASGSVSVEYAPGASELIAYERRVAFEAVTFPGGADSEVVVAGDFPSSATVIVTNESFEPLAISRTLRGTAAVRVPAGEGGRFVLVRDPMWVKPMTFEVSVRGSGR